MCIRDSMNTDGSACDESDDAEHDQDEDDDSDDDDDDETSE